MLRHARCAGEALLCYVSSITHRKRKAQEKQPRHIYQSFGEKLVMLHNGLIRLFYIRPYDVRGSPLRSGAWGMTIDFL